MLAKLASPIYGQMDVFEKIAGLKQTAILKLLIESYRDTYRLKRKNADSWSFWDCENVDGIGSF